MRAARRLAPHLDGGAPRVGHSEGAVARRHDLAVVVGRRRDRGVGIGVRLGERLADPRRQGVVAHDRLDVLHRHLAGVRLHTSRQGSVELRCAQDDTQNVIANVS
jgi:hypothetical protein